MVINIVNEVKNWKKAIQIAGNPLLENNKIEQRYIDSIINEVEKTGAYVYIAPYVALPHSRPEKGVIKQGISILKINKPTYILYNKKYITKLFIFLAAKDNNSHIDMLQKVTKPLLDNKKLKKILETTKIDELKKIFMD